MILCPRPRERARGADAGALAARADAPEADTASPGAADLRVVVADPCRDDLDVTPHA